MSESLYVIADIGLTCSGSVEKTLELIEVAHALGVNAVKMQMIDADELLGDKSVVYSYPTILTGDKSELMLDMFKRLEFSDDEWDLFASTCKRLDLDLIVTCHVSSAVKRINNLNLKFNKICTWSLSHYHMIRDLASNGKDLIIDTGTIDLEDLQDLEKFYQFHGGGNLIILYDFHTNNVKQMNISAIGSLLRLGYRVGYTPQGRDNWLDFMALGFGASMIEKRLTLNRYYPGNGHWKALDPGEFQIWMRDVKQCWSAIGDGNLRATSQDLIDAKTYYKSAFLMKDVRKGEVIKLDDFQFARPGEGVSSKEIFKVHVGTKYKQDFKSGDKFVH
jgi:sialic acid synthase SpsE